MAFFSVPVLVAAITARPGRSRARGAAAGAGGVDDQLALGGHAITQRGQFLGGNIRAHEIELVFDAVERAVADENKHEIVFRLGLAGRWPSVSVRRARVVLLADQRVDMRVAARGLENLVEILASPVNRCSYSGSPPRPATVR